MIRFDSVSKAFGPKRVLDNISFEVPRGEVFAIVGSSGTGKSVTLKHMVRLLTPDQGAVWIGDDEVSAARGQHLERIRQRFGFLFQSGALMQWLNIGDNIGLPLRQHTKLSLAEVDQRARRMLKLVHLDEEVFLKHPSDLSGGMQKRAALARAMITEPEIILYDEPTSGLDPVTSRTIDRLILDLSQNTGITSVVVTHDMHSALGIAGRIAMLSGGRLIELAPPADFIQSQQSEVQAFLDAQHIDRAGKWPPAKESQ
ncbi:MAG: ATP-binding cassette domain-containing protein [Candidatus Marinimicrobia bacterium]|nr:ATP-binding cassette domain-containing protein [Candidatus Neomarinimicrobiota bacterium]